jgi:pimeloyl-ACP methyl ester carboxylesterase
LSRFVDAGGVRLHVEEAGAGEPVVLLHGAPQHAGCWRKVMPLLAPHRRVIAPDLRGFGRSEAPGHGYDGETYARDVVALLDALAIEQATIVGHDWGGHAAWLLAARHGERVNALVALDAPHLWVRPSLRGALNLWRSWYTLAFIAGAASRPGFVAWMLRAGGRGWLFSDADVEDYSRQFREPERVRASQALYRYYHRVAATTARRGYDGLRLDMPVRLLYGEQEPLLAAPLFEGAVPAADYVLEAIPGAGHFLPEERPELVAERVLAL